MIIRGSEISSYKIELQNRIKQNDVTFRVANSKNFTPYSNKYHIKLNTENVIEWRNPCHFETEIIKDFFYLSNSRL